MSTCSKGLGHKHKQIRNIQKVDRLGDVQYCIGGKERGLSKCLLNFSHWIETGTLQCYMGFVKKVEEVNKRDRNKRRENLWNKLAFKSLSTLRLAAWPNCAANSHPVMAKIDIYPEQQEAAPVAKQITSSKVHWTGWRIFCLLVLHHMVEVTSVLPCLPVCVCVHLFTICLWTCTIYPK